MQQLLLIFHLCIACILITLILIQQGKGADVGASFGSGASQTIFGSQGSMPFFVKVTGFLAALFFVSCLLLGYVISQGSKQAAQANLPSVLRTNAPITAPQNIPIIPQNNSAPMQQTMPGVTPPMNQTNNAGNSGGNSNSSGITK